MNDSILRSRRILIKRIEDGKVVADTKIIRFDKYRNVCFIAADSLTDKGNYSVTVLIFGPDKLYEYAGKIAGGVIADHWLLCCLAGTRRRKTGKSTGMRFLPRE